MKNKITSWEWDIVFFSLYINLLFRPNDSMTILYELGVPEKILVLDGSIPVLNLLFLNNFVISSDKETTLYCFLFLDINSTFASSSDIEIFKLIFVLLTFEVRY